MLQYWLTRILSALGVRAGRPVEAERPAPDRRRTDRRSWAGPERRSGEERRGAAPVAKVPAPPAVERAATPAPVAPAAPARPAPAAAEVGEPELPALPAPRRGGGLDAEEHVQQTLQARQREIVDRIGELVDKGDYELPHLPSTSVVVINLAANPSSEIAQIVETISTDPVLSSRLLQLANSALYATQEPVETLHAAVMRVGLRELRSLIFALSMRQVLSRKNHLTSYADEIWRQSYSVGVIARTIGPMMGIERDKAFLLGLLHDVGKIPLIAMIERAGKNAADVTPSLVGRVFLEYHEHAGREMARRWKLSEEFVSVAGRHHRYTENEEHPRSAALVSLAHRLDLHLSMGKAIYWSQNAYPELDYLGIHDEARQELLKAAHEAFVQNGQADGGGEGAARAA